LNEEASPFRAQHLFQDLLWLDFCGGSIGFSDRPVTAGSLPRYRTVIARKVKL
jgi:hypothetical protein